jgi:hypothetical protein
MLRPPIDGKWTRKKPQAERYPLVSPVSGFAAKFGEDGHPTLGTAHPDQRASMRDSMIIMQDASCCKAQNRAATHSNPRHPSAGWDLSAFSIL